MSGKLITITLSEYDHLCDIVENGEKRHGLEIAKLEATYQKRLKDQDELLCKAIKELKEVGGGCSICANNGEIDGICENFKYDCEKCTFDSCKCRDCRKGNSHFEWCVMAKNKEGEDR